MDVTSSPKPAWLCGISAAALMLKHFPPLRYVVHGYVAEGLTILAGAPKLGKSWMALNIAVAVAGGEPAFGTVPCETGDVLYLALEDNERRLRSRLLAMGCQEAPDRLTLCTRWPTLADGAVEQIEEWAASVPKPTLVVIDVLAKVREAASGRDTAYDADYRTLTALQELAGARNIAIVVIHHTRKQESDDPFDSVSGTRGLTGAADTVLVLKKEHANGRTVLYGRGRDLAEIETVFEFDGGRWSVRGEAADLGRTDERGEILELLKDTDQAMSPKEVSDLLGKKPDAVRQTLTRMAHAGEIEKVRRGLYTCHNGHNVTTPSAEASLAGDGGAILVAE